MNNIARPGVTVKGPIRLGATWRKTVYVIGLGVWASGALWLLFHFFLRQATEFGPQAHPLEPWWLRLHGAFAFAALWLIGRLSASHIVNGWAAGRRRWSGGMMIALCGVLTVTGYLLYYLGDNALRPVSTYTHWVVGLGAPLFLVLHRVRVRGKSL